MISTTIRLLGIALLSASPLAAQHEAQAAAHAADTAAHHGMKGTHRLTLGLGHNHVINSVVGEDGELKNQSMPMWSFIYDYWLSDKLALGVQTDLVVESFVIEHGDDELLERNYPLLVVAVAIAKVSEHFSFIGGIGAEWAHGHRIGATRLGGEYGTHLSKSWEVGIAGTWDAKWSYYNSWGIAFAVSHLFGGHR